MWLFRFGLCFFIILYEVWNYHEENKQRKKRKREQEYVVEKKCIITCRSRDLTFVILMFMVEIKITLLICWGSTQETKFLMLYTWKLTWEHLDPSPGREFFVSNATLRGMCSLLMESRGHFGILDVLDPPLLLLAVPWPHFCTCALWCVMELKGKLAPGRCCPTFVQPPTFQAFHFLAWLLEWSLVFKA